MNQAAIFYFLTLCMLSLRVAYRTGAYRNFITSKDRYTYLDCFFSAFIAALGLMLNLIRVRHEVNWSVRSVYMHFHIRNIVVASLNRLCRCTVFAGNSISN